MDVVGYLSFTARVFFVFLNETGSKSSNYCQITKFILLVSSPGMRGVALSPRWVVSELILSTKVPYVTSPQLMSHRHASTVSRQVLVLQKKECVPAGRRTTEFLYQAYRTVGSDACSDGYSRCVQYGRFEY